MFTLLVWIGSAWGQAAGCDALDESGFLTRMTAAQNALNERLEVVAFISIVDDLRRDLPCLSFTLSSREWAEYLVLEAVLEYGRRGDWEAPLDAALVLRPQVDRGVGGAHPIARYAPAPTEEPPGIDVGEEISLYVDGEPARELPVGPAIHLVQRQEGGQWRTRVHRADDPVSLEWLLTPFPRNLRWQLRGVASLVMGPGGASQRRPADWPSVGGQDGDPNHVAPDLDWWAPWPSVTGRGVASYGRLSVIGEVELALLDFVRVTGGTAQAFAGLRVGSTHLGLGGGVGGTTLRVGPAPVGFDTLSLPMPYGGATAQVWRPRGEAGVAIGLGPGGYHSTLFAGVHRPIEDTVVLRFGLSGMVHRGGFTAVAADTQDVELGLDGTVWKAGLEIGLAAGPRAQSSPQR